MRLSKLLSSLIAVRLPNGEWDGEIDSIVTDSAKAGEGCLFVCLRGPIRDGHTYAQKAYARGCRHFLCEYPPALPPDAYVAYVPDCRPALAALSGAWYGYPERELTLIGITGTKGKTTTAVMAYRLLREVGIPVGYIGSGGVWYADVQRESENTTPDAPTLRAAFADMRRHGVRAVIMEVSSQAISCERIAGLSFPICLFTNLACDHVGEGEHPDFWHYREAKARLFSDMGCRTMIANLDDPTAPYMMARACATETVTLSCRRTDTSLYATRLRENRQDGHFATSFMLGVEGEDCFPVSIPLPGECNVQNALAALALAREFLQGYEKQQVPLRTLARLLSDVTVPGRFEAVRTPLPEVDFLIDYAHNGYSLAAALRALRAYSPARLCCLFGSVGERTYSRRTELAQAACAADFCVVTADNPGTEPPEDTMREICRVLEENGREYVAIPDREEAIRYAVRHARAGDVWLLAGKGHESYQLLGERRVPFSERGILLSAAAELVTVPLLQ